MIPGSPIDMWAAESYSRSHSRSQIRKDNQFIDDDMLVMVVGSTFFYNELSWDYAVAMHNIGPLLINYARGDGVGVSFKFVFLCGNSSGGYDDALQVHKPDCHVWSSLSHHHLLINNTLKILACVNP